MKIALYLRVSSDVQDFNRQKVDLTAKAISEGNEIAFIFSDKISGLKDEKDRPELNQLLKLTKDDIEAVYISELSRLSRNPTHLKVLMDQFTSKGINIYSLTQNINTLNKDGKVEFTTALMVSILSEYSSYELTLKNQRVASGKKDAIFTKGNSYTTKPPFGYKKENKKLVINIQEAEVVSEIFNKYANGEGIADLIQYMNLKKIPTRNTDFIKKSTFQVNKSRTINKEDIKWGKSSIKAILNNTVYCGYKIISGDNKILTPAIISEDLFLNCKSEMSKRRTSTDKSKKHDFMFRGYFTCGECGKQMLGYKNLGYKNHPDLIYRCADKTHKKLLSFNGCNNASIFKNHMESMVWDTIKYSYQTLRNRQIAEGNITSVNDKIEEATSQIEAINRELTRLSNESERLVKLYVKGIFSEESLDKEQKIINAEYESLIKLKSKLETSRIDLRGTLKAIANIELNYFDLAEAEKSYQLQKEAARELVKEITIHKIDSEYTVFEIDFKAGYSNYIIRQTWTKKYQIVDGKMFVYNRTDKLFNFSSDNDSKFRVDTLFADLQRNY